MKGLTRFLRWLLALLEKGAAVSAAAPSEPIGNETGEPEKPAFTTQTLSMGNRFILAGIQNKTRHEALRGWGCYFFLLYRWAQELKHSLKAKDYIAWYNRCVQAGFITDDKTLNKRAFIENAAEVMNTLVGTRLFSRVRHVDRIPDNMCMFPVRVRNGNTAHFILQTKSGGVWDSLGGGPYPVINYREIR